MVIAVDLSVVLVFAALGRRFHDGGLTGVLETAWPFVVGLLVGHAFARGSADWRAGLVVWIPTVVGGMVLRQLTGDGTAWSFVLVATGFLGAGLLGWRLLRLVVSRLG